MTSRVFGIRHHGPGSGRALARSLAAWAPDIVLVEGPPEAEAALSLAASPAMVPPVALLAYLAADPRRGIWYPLASWSPEWRALGHAQAAGIPLRMIDLPAAATLGKGEEAEEANDRPGDPLAELAAAAGYDDAERWWEDVVEHRDGPEEPWDALTEAMAELRAGSPPLSANEARREAHMRQGIRRATKEGHQRIAVVCGAWHAPAFVELGPAKPDADLLRGLPRDKVAVTWVPWTSARLAFASGYGAGVTSPGWYGHLAAAPDHPIERWLARVAALLREEGLSAPPASVVEAVRLAETLAALRGRPLAGLGECTDAVQAVLAGGSPLPMSLLHRRLVVGEDLGEVPPETPMVPLAGDLAARQRRLRLKPTAGERELDLDLRKANDLARSHLLHRLALLGVPWGWPEEDGRGTGTFHEVWVLRWEPELALRVIEASVWGATVEQGAEARARDRAEKAGDLLELTALVEAGLLADLPAAVVAALGAVDDRAAQSTDAGELMAALAPLARSLRYGSVRRTDQEALTAAVGALLTRVTVGLGPACAGLDDEAAATMIGRLATTTDAVATLDEPVWRDAWLGALAVLVGPTGGDLHGLVAGHVTRQLLDAGRMDAGDVARRLAAALSRGAVPAHGAAWIEGLLGAGGMLLVHDRALFDLIDGWVAGVDGEVFEELLPLLRRAFSSFEVAERRMLGDIVRCAGRKAPTPAQSEVDQAALDAAETRALLLLRGTGA